MTVETETRQDAERGTDAATELAVVRRVETRDIIVFAPEQRQLIRDTIWPTLTEPEFAAAIYLSQRAGLDPIARQIHAVKRFNKQLNREVMTMQTGIDGYRLIAQRTGEYAGSDDPIFEKDAASGHPTQATVTVYRIVKGTRCPFTATARWREYAPQGEKLSFMWAKMPFGQLGKCAEALALRKGFALELSGLYTHEEMAQADNPDAMPAPAKDAFAPNAPTRAERQSPPSPAPVLTDVVKSPEFAAMQTAFKAKYPGSSKEQFFTFCDDQTGAAVDLREPSNWTMELVKRFAEVLK